jgi:hypothetical protein
MRTVIRFVIALLVVSLATSACAQATIGVDTPQDNDATVDVGRSV